MVFASLFFVTTQQFSLCKYLLTKLKHGHNEVPGSSIIQKISKCHFYKILEIPALQVFLGAEAQLLGTSLAGTRMPLTICPSVTPY